MDVTLYQVNCTCTLYIDMYIAGWDNWLYFNRNVYGKPGVNICNSSNSKEAASYFYHNRYPSYSECFNPCTSMQIKTQLQTKRRKENGFLYILLSRKTALSEEIYVKSVFTVGMYAITKSHLILIDIKLLYSCRTRWIPWNDSWNKSFGLRNGNEENSPNCLF